MEQQEYWRAKPLWIQLGQDQMVPLKQQGGKSLRIFFLYNPTYGMLEK